MGRFPALPADPAALFSFTLPAPKSFPGVIEGEALIASAIATEGAVSAQDMGSYPGAWSGGEQLWWRPAQSGSTLTLVFNAPADGNYDLIGWFTRADDYGKFQFALAGSSLGEPLDLYAPDVTPTGSMLLGRVALKAGRNTLVVTVTGKNERSTNTLFGLDALILKPVK